MRNMREKWWMVMAIMMKIRRKDKGKWEAERRERR